MEQVNSGFIATSEKYDVSMYIEVETKQRPHFSAFGLNTERYSIYFHMQENKDQNISKYGDFFRQC